MKQTRCPDCGYARPSSAEDAPAFHKPGCPFRRKLIAGARKEAAKATNKNLKTYRGAVTVTLGGDSQCKLDATGQVVAAISFDGLRWRASA